MSDSEDFESADEGREGDDGWDVDDFDLPDIEPSQKPKVTEIQSSASPHVSNQLDTEHSFKGKQKNTKSSSEINTPKASPALQSRLENLTVNNNNSSSGPQIQSYGKSEIIQNETKPSNTQDSVSKIY